MGIMIIGTLALMAAAADAQTIAMRYPSCDLRRQHASTEEVGGSIKDPRQAHVSMRAHALQVDLGSAARTGRVTHVDAVRLSKRVKAVEAGAGRYVEKQGFLSAGEVEAYDRELDAVAMHICRP